MCYLLYVKASYFIIQNIDENGEPHVEFRVNRSKVNIPVFFLLNIKLA